VADNLLRTNFDLEAQANAKDKVIHSEKMLQNATASRQLEALADLQIVVDSRNRVLAVHRNVLLIGRERTLRKASMDQLKADLNSLGTTISKMNTQIAELEAEQTRMKNNTPTMRRNCRSFREKEYLKLTEESRTETEIAHNLSAKAEYNQVEISELNRYISVLTETDSILHGIRERRVALLERLTNDLQKDTLALETAKNNLSKDLSRIVDQGNSQSNRTHLEVSQRNRTIFETPAFEAELTMKDEQIYNASTKQVESMIHMAELAPNITDKEADFSIWNKN
jgi:hypothetical protein